MSDLNYKPIAIIRNSYKEKFGIPRQSGLAKSIKSTVKFLPEFAQADAIRGLEQASHIWLIFSFSKVQQDWQPLVRPPRLGGNKKLGVFASRSPFRPNPIGLSAVKLLEIKQDKQLISLTVEGADLLDGTPILDIKPYLPYADSIETAEFALAQNIEYLDLPVIFSDQAQYFLAQHNHQQSLLLMNQIIEILRLDPRPAYQKNTQERSYSILFEQFDIHWKVEETRIYIEQITGSS